MKLPASFLQSAAWAICALYAVGLSLVIYHVFSRHGIPFSQLHIISILCFAPQIVLLIILYNTDSPAIRHLTVASLALVTATMLLTAFYNVPDLIAEMSRVPAKKTGASPDEKTMILAMVATSSLQLSSIAHLAVIAVGGLLVITMRRFTQDESTRSGLARYLPQDSLDRASIGVTLFYSLAWLGILLHESASPSLFVMGSWIFGIGPQILLLHGMSHLTAPSRKKAVLALQVVFAALSLLAWHDSFGDTPDPQAGLLFIWLPIWQYAGLLGIGAAFGLFRLVKKAVTR